MARKKTDQELQDQRDRETNDIINRTVQLAFAKAAEQAAAKPKARKRKPKLYTPPPQTGEGEYEGPIFD